VKNYINILIFSLLCLNLSAQRGWEAGGWLGMAQYFGDLNTDFQFNDPKLAGGIALRYNFNERVCLKFGANMGSVAADDANSDNIFERARNLHFRSRIGDIAGQLEFNFLPYFHGDKDYFWTPYLFAGYSVSYFNPQAEIDGDWVDLRPLGTEGQFKSEEYFTVSGGLLYGGGFKIDLNYEWSINVEIGARKLFTDYLDDVSTVYADVDDVEDLRGPIAARLVDRSAELFQEDPSFFTSNNIEYPIGEPGRQRGNSKTNDTYVMIGIGVMYYFGDLRCPYDKTR
jgi:hypothetical protein